MKTRLVRCVCLFLGLALLASAVHAPRGWGWTEQAILHPSDVEENDGTGRSVGISGDTVLIGSFLDGDNGQYSGSAYVFVRSGTTWREQAKLLPSDGAAGDKFGEDVAIDGDTALVASYLDDDRGTDSGSAYVFVRSGSTWSQQAKLTANDGATLDGFGYTVSIDGDTAVIGAPNHNYFGAAYVFVRTGTTWTEQAKLRPGDGAGGDYFGLWSCLEGDRVAVSSVNDDDNGTDSGSAYIFTRSGTTWTQQAKITANDGEPGDWFGSSLSLSGDTLLVGARSDDDFGDRSGAAYVFVLSGSTWSEQDKLYPDDPAKWDTFGYDVVVSGDRAFVGSPGTDVYPGSLGAIYIFDRVDSLWTQTTKLTHDGTYYVGDLGRTFDLSGDTLVAGVLGCFFWPDFTGAAYVFVHQAEAEVTYRNHGYNHSSYYAMSLPVLGGTYTGYVDLGGSTGHALALLVGYLSPLTLTLGGGQVLLVDVLDPGGEVLFQSAVGGPVATFDIPVPADASLAGVDVATQALHFGGVQPFALSNAQDLFLGY